MIRKTADGLVAKLNALSGDRYATTWEGRIGYVIMNLTNPAPDLLPTVKAAEERLSRLQAKKPRDPLVQKS